MYKIKQVSVKELSEMLGFKAMIDEYANLAIKSMPTPKFNVDNYAPLEAAGVLSVWAVTCGYMVVGFASCIASRIPHYGVGVAIVESLFVREVSRYSGVALKLLSTLEAHAVALKAPALFVSCPVHSDFKRVLLRRNYSDETVTYVKAFPCSQ